MSNAHRASFGRCILGVVLYVGLIEALVSTTLARTLFFQSVTLPLLLGDYERADAVGRKAPLAFSYQTR